MKHDTHTQHIMRDTDSFYVRICSCGVVHLCFGATTLNLTSQAVIAVTETLKQVSQELLVRGQNTGESKSSPNQAESENVIQLNFSNP